MKSSEALAALSLKHDGDWVKIYCAIKDHQKINQEEAERLIAENNTKFITMLDDEYPEILKNIYNPPIVLFYKGDISLLKRRRILAVVGNRECSDYGIYATKKIISELDDDIVILSGLAKGIDAEAHKAALEKGNPTIAFLGCGINYIYPIENHQLYKDIEKNGLIISEYPGMTTPDKAHFPYRNRLIAGLAKGVLVVEGKRRSGTSTTVTAAAAFGKDVFAIPSPISDENNSLCNDILREGAILIRSGEDINEEI